MYATPNALAQPAVNSTIESAVRASSSRDAEPTIKIAPRPAIAIPKQEARTVRASNRSDARKSGSAPASRHWSADFLACQRISQVSVVGATWEVLYNRISREYSAALIPRVADRH